MLCVGIDCHKRYAQVNAIDEKGTTRAHSRLSNDLSTVEDFFRSLNEPCKAEMGRKTAGYSGAFRARKTALKGPLNRAGRRLMNPPSLERRHRE